MRTGIAGRLNYLLRREIREMKATAGADIMERQAKMWRASEQSNQEAPSGSLAMCNGIANPSVIAHRTNPAWENVLSGSSRSSLPMTTGISAVAARMPLASPDERRWVTIPSLDGVAEPVFEDLHIIDVVSLQGSPDDNALHGF